MKNIETLLANKDEKMMNLFANVKQKFENFETSLNTLKKCIVEKDIRIGKLEDILTKQNSKSDTKVKCSQCDFEGNSEHGLKVHMARKHTVVLETNIKCELCGETFEKSCDLKKHVKTHSYKKASFKCVECEFVGSNEVTMAVHSGKTHSDNFDCGICEYQAKSKEELEIHLFTCEIYICSVCRSKEKTLSDLKKHTEDEHTPYIYNNLMLYHNKIDRSDQEEVCCTSLYWKDI